MGLPIYQCPPGLYEILWEMIAKAEVSVTMLADPVVKENWQGAKVRYFEAELVLGCRYEFEQARILMGFSSRRKDGFLAGYLERIVLNSSGRRNGFPIFEKMDLCFRAVNATESDVIERCRALIKQQGFVVSFDATVKHRSPDYQFTASASGTALHVYGGRCWNPSAQAFSTYVTARAHGLLPKRDAICTLATILDDLGFEKVLWQGPFSPSV